MYKKNKQYETTLSVNSSYEGERIEQKIQRITQNKEPISDSAPLVYTERKDGVKAEYNIKTDRFELAIEAMDIVSKSMRAKREQLPKIGEEAIEGMKKEDNTKGESAQTTNDKP